MHSNSNCRNIKTSTILILAVFFIISCSDRVDGKWDDIIKLSTKSVDFTANVDSITITTEGDWWWIDGITFADSTYHYYQREDINLESDSYSIIEDCFVVERREKNALFVKLNKNNTGKERILNISLEAGDYFDYVYINQAAN